MMIINLNWFPASFGKYAVEGILGWGGDGTVFRCRDGDLARCVAVEAISRTRNSADSRLKSEAQKQT